MKANFQKWSEGQFSAWERRILITKWVAEAVKIAYEKTNIPRLFEKTGISLPIDGSLDSRINISGLEGYEVGDWENEDATENISGESESDKSEPDE